MSTTAEPISADDWAYIREQLQNARSALRRANDAILGNRTKPVCPRGHEIQRAVQAKRTWLALQEALRQADYCVMHARSEVEGRTLEETVGGEQADTETP